MSSRSLSRPTALLALGFAVSGCDSVLAPVRAVLLQISEIDAPASITQGATLVVRLTVVFGGCRSFERLETTRAAARVTFKAHGRDSSGPRVSCTADVRTQVVESRIEPPLTDPVTLVALQPDASETTRTVRITTR